MKELVNGKILPCVGSIFKSRYIRFFISCFILYFIFSSVDLPAVIELKDKVRFGYLILFLSITFPMIWASSMKWRMFIPASVTPPGIFTLMRFYTISYFINLFFPSSFGGDAARSLKLGKIIENHKKAFVATFFERLTGLFSLLVVGFIGACFGDYQSSEIIYVIVPLFFCVVFALFALASNKGNLFLKKIIAFLPTSKLKNKVLMIFNEPAPSGLLKPKFFIKAMLWSFFFYFLAILNTYWALKTISVDTISILDLSLVVPLVLLILTIPLTPGAIGVQEGAFFYFLTKLGAAAPEAIAVALLFRIKTLLIALIGWLLTLKKET